MKKFFVLLAALSLSACEFSATTPDGDGPSYPSGSGGYTNPNQDGNQAGGQRGSILSTRSQCVSDTPATDVTGKWEYDMGFNDIVFHMQFTFAGNDLNVTNICEFPNGHLTASVDVPYMQNNGALSILGSAHDDESGTGMECKVAVQQRSINYRFDGGCLVLNDPHDGDIYLRHVN